MTRLRYATRKSALALAQSRMVMRLICEARPGVTVEEVQVVTQGDRVVDRPLAEIGGKGLFVKEIEEALRDGRADVAVHSMKDLPADLAEGLIVGCVPERESPYDLLVTADGRSLDALAQGACVGTSSRRREVALRALRPDLDVRMLRGNVDTRVRKLREGEYDAIVLAEAGVRRLGVTVEAARLDGVIVPAVAQGALALETRAEDTDTWEIVRAIHHLATERETEAERAVMRALGGSCTVPMGALARYEAGTERMTMEGFYAGDDGTLTARATLEGSARNPDEARALGQKLAETLRRRADSARA